MNKFLRLLSLLLVTLMSFSTFAACDGVKEKETDTSSGDSVSSVAPLERSETESETEIITEYLPEIEKKNYDTQFFLWMYSAFNKPEYHWVEESSNDVLTEALYNRQEKVYEHLGVEIVGRIFEDNTTNLNTYTDPFRTAVKNKDGSVHTLLTHAYYGVSGLVADQYLADIASLPGVNLDADYWNAEYMEDLSIADKYYLGKSNFNILYTYILTFNKTMMEQYGSALDKNVYDMVRDYEWTFDKMINLANLVYIDTTADGKTLDDIFGITGHQWYGFTGFLHAANIQMVERNESGDFVVSLMTKKYADKTAALAEKLNDLSKADCAQFNFYTDSESAVPFETGRTLLHIDSTTDLEKYLNYDISFGILPYPIWDTDQKDVGYRHLEWSGYITVPAYAPDFQMLGETLELLAFYSDDVKTAYYEKVLGKQISDLPDDREMLTIVWDSLCSDFAQPYCQHFGSSSFLFMLANVTEANSDGNIASYVAGLERSTNSSIAKFVQKVEKAASKK